MTTVSTMLLHFLLLGSLASRAACYFSEEKYPEESKMQPPTVVIAIIARNSAHSLPYYLGALERLNYPKERVSVWWVSCVDSTAGCMLCLSLSPSFLNPSIAAVQKVNGI